MEIIIPWFSNCSRQMHHSWIARNILKTCVPIHAFFLDLVIEPLDGQTRKLYFLATSCSPRWKATCRNLRIQQHEIAGVGKLGISRKWITNQKKSLESKIFQCFIMGSWITQTEMVVKFHFSQQEKLVLGNNDIIAENTSFIFRWFCMGSFNSDDLIILWNNFNIFNSIREFVFEFFEFSSAKSIKSGICIWIFLIQLSQFNKKIAN